MSFPKDFIWGSAASSYQIEGAAREDGKGPSVWDSQSHWPGKVWKGETGDVTCDHYHRYKEDARLMGELGLQAYRLSVSWPRILPEGVGKVNEKGLAFYDQLVDALLENGVEPWILLFHWDYPQALYNRGGWLNPASADWFAAYTRVVVDKLSDRVTHWFTQNEPQCFVGDGHMSGIQAPGLQLSFADALLVNHNALLAHGKSVQVIRKHAKATPIIGAAPVGCIKTPLRDTPEDIEAARAETFAIKGKHFWNNTWITDPMIWGHYPEDGLKLFEQEMPEIKDGDMETICQPLDFYGANIYHSLPVSVAEDGSTVIEPLPPGIAVNTMDWQVTPDALYWGPRFLYERYKMPIVVTENGFSCCDWVHLDGKVHDPQRIDFLTRYLMEYKRAIDDGVDARGYFAWSIMDNFEWSWGYKRRWGLIFVDFNTGKRTPKDSAYWYRDVIASNGDIIPKL